MERFNKTFSKLASEYNVEGHKPSQTDIVRDFIKFVQKKIGFKRSPPIKLSRDKKRVHELKSMACVAFDGEKASHIWIYIDNRNTADVLRSIAHELVHVKQKEALKGSREIDGSTGSEEENEANSVAGSMLRLYGQAKPEIYD